MIAQKRADKRNHEDGHLSFINPEDIENTRKDMTNVASKLAVYDIPVRYVGSHDDDIFAYKGQLAQKVQFPYDIFAYKGRVVPCPKFIMHACREY